MHLYDWSPDGKFLAVGADVTEVADLSFKNDIYLLNIETKEFTSVTNGTGYFGNASWSPDGKYLGIIGHEREYQNATLTKIWLYQTDIGTFTCFAPDWDVPVGDYMVGDFQQGASSPGLIWAGNSQGFYFIASEQGSTNIYSGDLKNGVKPVLVGEAARLWIDH